MGRIDALYHQLHLLLRFRRFEGQWDLSKDQEIPLRRRSKRLQELPQKDMRREGSLGRGATPELVMLRSESSHLVLLPAPSGRRVLPLRCIWLLACAEPVCRQLA